MPSLGKPFFFNEGYPLSQKQNSHHETILEIFINKHLRIKKQTSSNYFKTFFLFSKKSFCFVSRNIEFSINLIFYVEHNKPPPSPSPPPPFFSKLFHVATSCIYMISLLSLWILIYCLYLHNLMLTSNTSSAQHTMLTSHDTWFLSCIT